MSAVEQISPIVSGKPPLAETAVAVSVIIPALNEEKMIGCCLESLAQLNFARDRFEVIVVDNGSADQTSERARAGGMTVRAAPEMGVVHLGMAQSLHVFFRKQAWHGTHVVKVFLRNVSGSHNLKAVLFAAYTLVCLFGIIVGAAWAVMDRGAWWAPLVASAGLFLPPVALSMKQVWRSRKWGDFFPLTALYLTYGIARAKALLSVGNFF